MVNNILIFIAGLAILHYASVSAIAVSKDLGKIVGIPQWLIAAFLLSFGTSLPEAVVTIASSLKGLPKLALANIVGSNIANISLALALPWAIFGLQKYKIQTSLLVEFLLVHILLALVTVYVNFNIVTGILLILLYVLFILIKINKHQDKSKHQEHINQSTGKVAAKALIACVLIPLASHFIVESADNIVKILGISETFFGLIFLAIGTSIPECYACFIAIRKSMPEVAIGNVIGSNIVNSTLVAGLIGIFSKSSNIDYSSFIDSLVVMIAFAIMLFLLLTYKALNKFFAVAIFLAYLAYILLLFANVI